MPVVSVPVNVSLGNKDPTKVWMAHERCAANIPEVSFDDEEEMRRGTREARGEREGLEMDLRELTFPSSRLHLICRPTSSM